MNLTFNETVLPGVILIKSSKFEDERGWLSESYNKDVFVENGILEDFIQEKHSFSKYGVIRGLHYQAYPFGQGKLVRCCYGQILDVVVDINPSSKTFGKHISIILDNIHNDMLYIPPGFAHGFSVISSNGAGFNYLTTARFNPSADTGILFSDPEIAIDWKIPFSDMIVSDKDKNLPLLKTIK